MRHVGDQAFILGGLLLATVACTSDAGRVANLEQRLDALTTDFQLLPQQVETIRIRLDSLDQGVRSRQSRMTAELGQLRSEDLHHLTHRLEALAESFHQFRKEMAAGTVDRLGNDLAELQATVSEMGRTLQVLEEQHAQSFAAETVWLASVSGQLESVRTRLMKGSPGKRPPQATP